jgi:molecular chaperone DnaK
MMKMGEAAYQEEQENTSEKPEDSASADDGVVDADFEEVDDEQDVKKA